MASEILEATETRVSKPEGEYEPEEIVTVLHGYGRVSPTNINYIDGYKFVGGIARNIPFKNATSWKKRGMKIYIQPNSADEADFAKATGIVPMEPERLSTMLVASDMDAVFRALGNERAMYFVQELGDRLGKKLTDPVKSHRK